ncbi:MAG: ABC transporter ATP-binding protein [Candidatus Heimdallarchaeaceae archaeon]
MKEEKIRVLKLSWKLLKFKPVLVFFGFLSDILFFLTPLMLSLIIREIFNKIEHVSNFNISIWVLILLLIPLARAFNFLADAIFFVTMMPYVKQAQILLRKNMLVQIFSLPGAEALTDTAGESVSRFRGDVEEAIWFTYEITQKFSIAVFAGFSFLVMQKINWQVTAYLSIPFTIMIFLVLFSKKKIIELRKTRRKAAGAVTRAIGEIYHSIQAIKITNSEERVLRYFDSINEKRRKAEIKDELFVAILNSIYRITVSVGIGIVLYIVGNSLTNNTFTIGDLALFVGILNSLADFIWDIGDFIPRYLRTKVSYSRIFKLVRGRKRESYQKIEEKLVNYGPVYINKSYTSQKSDLNENYEPLQKLIVRNLSYIFPDSNKGIENVSFEIEQGTLTVLTGRVGSGKTTLLRTLLGLYDKQSGEISWNNKKIEDCSSFFIPPRTAYTPQVPHLFSDTIKENILLGLEENNIDIEKALKLAVLEDEIEKFEKKSETLIGPKGVKLSGGQKQRLATARMFARKSDLYIFDDLSSALDVKTEQELWKRIFKYKEMTCFAVSHRKMILKKADKILLLKDGKIEQIGKLDELLTKSEEMQKIWKGEI